MVKRLPDSELEIMMAIWSCEQPVTRMQIRREVGQGAENFCYYGAVVFVQTGRKGVCHGYKRGENECLSCQNFKKRVSRRGE